MDGPKGKFEILHFSSDVHTLESSLGRVHKWSAISMKIHMRYPPKVLPDRRYFATFRRFRSDLSVSDELAVHRYIVRRGVQRSIQLSA